MKYRKTLPAVAAIALLAFIGCAETPQAGYQKTVQAAKSGNYGAVWDRFDKRSQGQLETMMQLIRVPLVLKHSLAGDKAKADRITNAAGRELFVLLIEESPEMKQKIADLTASVESATVDGDKATLTVTNNGQTEQVKMVREDDQWKIVLGDF